VTTRFMENQSSVVSRRSAVRAVADVDEIVHRTAFLLSAVSSQPN